MDRFGLCLRLVFLGVAALPVQANESTETVERSFELERVDGRRTVMVDNVQGEIHIVGGPGNQVLLTLVQTWRGRSASAVARAREAVVLEVNERPGVLELVQGGALSCKGRTDCDRRNHNVEFDWKLTVPKDVDLDLKNVNGGEIHVVGTEGSIAAKHVNDAIELEDVRGAVDLHTVNGRLSATFPSAPRKNLAFATVNGTIDLSFPKDMNGDLTFRTVNGELFTDFPYTLSLPSATGAIDRRKLPGDVVSDRLPSKPVHAAGRTQAKIGEGGIELRCDTVNGDITIRSL